MALIILRFLIMLAVIIGISYLAYRIIKKEYIYSEKENNLEDAQTKINATKEVAKQTKKSDPSEVKKAKEKLDTIRKQSETL
jgi:F0F1-type ATP synthase membrane subunit b/b'